MVVCFPTCSVSSRAKSRTASSRPSSIRQERSSHLVSSSPSAGPASSGSAICGPGGRAPALPAEPVRASASCAKMSSALTVFPFGRCTPLTGQVPSVSPDMRVSGHRVSGHRVSGHRVSGHEFEQHFQQRSSESWLRSSTSATSPSASRRTHSPTTERECDGV